ncbi:alpha/beta fold hydrolase [Paracoccus aerodenitrificans]|uniref:alpha/beta fold hydrolase n=1 Tax=Paracoccus aerodenitrificans TaxID=3017781 RepID=UPI0022F141C1|nr:alpha/beta hydrolase [Paracoccus aerodenitrificans]WBU65008.1 alpha/beta hydrolase [Paracoccus aerodenitrificans]
MSDFFEADDGAKLAYSDEGTGLPVLCLAGLSRNMADFDYVAPYLDGCRMIRMDYRGRGQSDYTGLASYTVPREAQDAVQLLDHLGLEKAAVLGTSRGGLIGLFMAATAHDRMSGLCLNDVGPVVEQTGLERIFEYIGRNPNARSYEELTAKLPAASPGFANVPEGRWIQDAERHYYETPDGLKIKYDPTLRESFIAAFEGDAPDLWPLWQATQGFPVALLRGANSDLLSPETAAEMRRQRPDLIFAEVPDRAHIPWLDESESRKVISDWIAAVKEAG